uniref:Uncharacterized protein n=1 Tax=Arundo donax TaxID=35708 RepID=A0A0A9HF45_ARUDO
MGYRRAGPRSRRRAPPAPERTATACRAASWMRWRPDGAAERRGVPGRSAPGACGPCACGVPRA